MSDPVIYYTTKHLLSKAVATGYAVISSRYTDLERSVNAGWLTRLRADLPADLTLVCLTDKGRAALDGLQNWFVHEDCGAPQNFEIWRYGDALHVDLGYPPYECDDNPEKRVRYVVVNQCAVRASDGIRIHYDYTRDGFAIEQPNERLTGTASPNIYGSETDWTETAFVESGACDTSGPDGPTQEQYDLADAEHRAIVGKTTSGC